MNNPLVAQRQDSTTSYTGIGIVESAVDLHNGVAGGSWVEGGLGFAGTGLEMLSLVIDPLGTLLQSAVSWIIEHVGPLRQALNWLAGDADQIAAYAQTWKNVSQAVGRARDDLASEVTRGTAGWSGASADAYRRSVATQAEHITAASSCSDTIGTVVQVVGVLVGTVRGIVRDLVAECVATLVARIPQWLAEEAVTLGFATPHVVASAVAIISKWVNRISDMTTKLVRSIAKLRPLMNRLGEIWDMIKKGLRSLRRAPDAPGGPKAPDPVKKPGTPDTKPQGGTGGTTGTSGTRGGAPVNQPPTVHGDGGGTTSTSGTQGGAPVNQPPTVHGDGATSTSGAGNTGGTSNPPSTGGTTSTSGAGGSGTPPHNNGGGGSGTPPPDHTPPPTPSGPQHPALPRRPADLSQPHPALTNAERAALDKHLGELETKHKTTFDEWAKDPDHNGKVRAGSKDEARIALDLQERGDFPSGLKRPDAPGQGDFIDGNGQAWDMKGAHSDWPPGVPDHVKAKPFPDAYTDQWFRDTVQDQFAKGRNVIMDTRNAGAADIANMRSIVEKEGWGGRIIWYP